MSLGTILLVVLILMLFGAFPRWGYSRDWGYGPSGGLGLLLVIVLILVLLGASEERGIRSRCSCQAIPDPTVWLDCLLEATPTEPHSLTSPVLVIDSPSINGLFAA